MPDAAPPPPPARPPVADGPLTPLADRWRSLRGDPRAGAVALLAVALAAGAFWFRTGVEGSAGAGGAAGGGGPATTAPVASTATTTTSTAPATVVIHVAGAVARPGVVSLPAGARVVDAIDAAGGAVPEADLDRLNLAALLADGQRVLVARVGDPPTPGDQPAGVSGGVTPADPGAAPGAPVLVNLNTATQAQLETLPGIGPTLAQSIIAERDRRGGFTSVEQLRQVRGIGDKRFADLRDLVTV